MKAGGEKGSKGQLEKYTNAAMSSGSDALWQFYRNFLQGPLSLVLPDHTRGALFQLFCDLRTNVPKDQKWAYQHGRALKPRTFPGWIALAAFACAALSLSALASSALIVTGLGFATALAGLIFVIGAIAGFWMLIVSGCLFASTFLFAWLATCSAIGYAVLTFLMAALNFTERAWQRITEPRGTQRSQSSSKQALGTPNADDTVQMQSLPSKTSADQSSASFISTARKPGSADISSQPKGSSSKSTEQILSNSNAGFLNEALNKGKRSFADIQQRLPSTISSLSFGQSSKSSPSQDSGETAGLNFTQGIKESIPGQVNSSDEKIVRKSEAIQPDLSPGRVLPANNGSTETQAVFGDSFTPEGGPTVPGKFAEAVHPDVASKIPANGHTPSQIPNDSI